MDYASFRDLLLKFELLEKIDIYLLSMVEEEIKDRDDKDTLLVFFSVLFSLIDDGNACVSLEKDTLLNKWHRKVDGKEVLHKEAEQDNHECFDEIRAMDQEIINALEIINNDPLEELIGINSYFFKENGYLYVKKYYDAKESIIKSIERLFKNNVRSIEYKE